MPRYSLTLSSTTKPRKRRSSYIWADSLYHAEMIARQRLRVAREYLYDRKDWNRWTVSASRMPGGAPQVLATGGPED